MNDEDKRKLAEDLLELAEKDEIAKKRLIQFLSRFRAAMNFDSLIRVINGLGEDELKRLLLIREAMKMGIRYRQNPEVALRQKCTHLYVEMFGVTPTMTFGGFITHQSTVFGSVFQERYYNKIIREYGLLPGIKGWEQLVSIFRDYLGDYGACGRFIEGGPNPEEGYRFLQSVRNDPKYKIIFDFPTLQDFYRHFRDAQ
ncbi:hypothetical protein HYV82_03365 [Candidatus Woesearchaeota archaeon]|nr:hypothetical protein [Candidatus Woesearchaeota archaeon]